MSRGFVFAVRALADDTGAISRSPAAAQMAVGLVGLQRSFIGGVKNMFKNIF
jgi:hypothetical protein